MLNIFFLMCDINSNIYDIHIISKLCLMSYTGCIANNQDICVIIKKFVNRLSCKKKEM